MGNGLVKNYTNEFEKDTSAKLGQDTLCMQSCSHVCFYLHIDVSGAALVHVEVDNLWTEACLHLDVHLVAGLHQLFDQIHVVFRQAMVGPESQSAWQETH